MLATDLAYALDAASWAEENFSLKLDSWQRQVLSRRDRRLILNCARQTGKSTVIALIALHEAIYFAPALVLLLSPSLRQSSELFRRVASFYSRLGSPVPSEAETLLRLELKNGSRIVSLPGKEATIRGFSGVSLLIVDEAARVPDSLYLSVRPMLAVSGGRLILLSTPFGTRGFFFREWRDGEGWKKVKVKATDCPRISQKFLAEERQVLGDWWYRQEYLCEFLDAQAAAFTYEQVKAAFKEEVEAWQL
jgi:hypothetical protein